MTAAGEPPRLLADIGGTNARFALADGGGIRDIRVLSSADHADLTAAVRAYRDGLADRPPITRAAFAVACPVDGDRVALTNHAWAFSIAETRATLGLESLRVVNDFTAVALSVPHLGAGDRRAVGGGTARDGFPIAVLGPGTGLGVSALVPCGTGWKALATEGGHVTLAARTDREDAVVRHLRRTFGHVSAERLLSGPGLVNLYETLSALDGKPVPAGITPAAITGRATGGQSSRCAEALDLFFGMLGTVAGNLALTLGAAGGAYVAGGIVPRMPESFERSPFRERFEDKGRFRAYLAAIPTFVVTHPQPAFLGLAGVA